MDLGWDRPALSGQHMHHAGGAVLQTWTGGGEAGVPGD